MGEGVAVLTHHTLDGSMMQEQYDRWKCRFDYRTDTAYALGTLTFAVLWGVHLLYSKDLFWLAFSLMLFYGVCGSVMAWRAYKGRQEYKGKYE